MKARTIKSGNSQGIRIPKVVLDQIRTVDKTRLIRKLGRIDLKTRSKVLIVLDEMFST